MSPDKTADERFDELFKSDTPGDEPPMTVTVILSDEIFGYMDLLVEEGRFESHDAAVEAALKMMLDADKAADIAYVRAALEEAARSGPPVEVDLDKFVDDLASKWQQEDRDKSSSAAE